jgi:hypothetical protein
MKIIAIDKIKSGVDLEQVLPHMKEEAKIAWGLYKSEIFREMYFRQDKPGVVLIMECKNVEEAKNALAKLPLVKKNLIEFEIIPVGYFSPFEVLFSEK